MHFNERFGHGGGRGEEEGKLQDCNLKTQTELAKEAGVSKRTISTAVAVEKTGQAEEVIAGKKTATEVLTETQKSEALVKFRTQKRALCDRIRETPLAEKSESVLVAAHVAYELSEDLAGVAA